MNKLFQKRLNELLSKKLYTYDELSQKLGLKSKGTITKYVSGQIKNPSINTIIKIAKLYNVSPIWLSGLSNNKYANMNVDEFVKIEVINDDLDNYIIVSSKDASSNDYIALIQKDDSLSPEILRNDKLLIKCLSAYEPGKLYAVKFKDEIFVRRINKTDIGIMLKPINSDYEPIVCLEKDIKNFKVLGEIVKSERFYELNN